MKVLLRIVLVVHAALKQVPGSTPLAPALALESLALAVLYERCSGVVARPSLWSRLRDRDDGGVRGLRALHGRLILS